MWIIQLRSFKNHAREILLLLSSLGRAQTYTAKTFLLKPKTFLLYLRPALCIANYIDKDTSVLKAHAQENFLSSNNGQCFCFEHARFCVTCWIVLYGVFVFCYISVRHSDIKQWENTFEHVLRKNVFAQNVFAV